MNERSATDGQRPGRPATVHRILVVDDNADAATSLGRLLRLSGYDVCVANDGPAAIAAVQQFRPRVVLLDLGMPGMDGLQTAGHIQRLSLDEPITFIAITGWGHDEDRQRTRAAGFAEHFVKPIKIGQLEAALERIVA